MEKDIQSNDPDHALDGPISTTFLRYLITQLYWRRAEAWYCLRAYYY